MVLEGERGGETEGECSLEDMELRVEESSGEERGEGADLRMLESMILREGEVGLLGVEEGKGSGAS